MLKHAALACALFFSISLIAPAQESNANSGRTLEVHVSYTGTGTIDNAHKIYVVLWDSAKFTGESPIMPVDVKSIASKDSTVTFSDVKTVPAYVSAAYDPTGAWDAQSAPPNGSSLGMYGTRGKPTPIDIAPGKTVKVKLTMDDSVKMPPPKQ